MAPGQRHSSRTFDFAAAAAILLLAAAISPLGLRLATGRLDLSPRITVLSLAFDVFLLVLAGAILASGRIRRVFFHFLAWTFPLALLAALEMGAVALHLADRIAPLEDLSILANRDHWPAHMMSSGRRVEKDGVPVYLPWQGEGIDINALGLRTAMPSPKSPGEWRIALVGGSAAFGWRVPDADTIAVRLQQALQRAGYSNVTVYNFAVDAITLVTELAIVNRYRDRYAIDHVVFYTGANDATNSYLSDTAPQNRFAQLLSGPNAFELLKVASRLGATLTGPSPAVLARFDNDVLPKLAERNTLRDGVIAADEYCRAKSLRCDFVLQPMLLTRKPPRGSEIRLAHTLGLLYPRYDQVVTTMYRSVMTTGASVHDGSDLFDQSAEPYFFDVVHVNEAGNRYAAERIAEIISDDLPKPGHRVSKSP
jgi:hypothetical protein